jgi:DNA-binding MarR family transcriptional regulator
MDESAVRAARELRVVFSRVRRQLRQVAAIQDLSSSQTSVLTLLFKEGATTASALAATERVRPQSMAATLAALDQQDLIERTADPTDGRRQLITLSAKGRERAEGDSQARGEWLARAMHERYTEAERQTMIEAIALLDRLTHP